MKKWLKYFEHFYKNKWYVLLLALTAVGSYGFIVTHPTIGIDDTPYAYYFEEGLAAIVGRWVLFLLNKVVHVADFMPFLPDLAAVLIFMAAVTVWCVLIYSIFADAGKEQAIPWYGYFFFGAVFISCPLISEVFTYYLHNGIAIGYLCCGISLCCFREGLSKPEGQQPPKRILPTRRMVASFLASASFLWIALGCYESFMIVWLQGVCLVLLTERFAGIRRSVFRALCMAAGIAVMGIVLRSIMVTSVTAVFGLEYLKEEAVQRSVTEMAGWILQPGAKAELGMFLKRFLVMYGVFGYAYYPIKIFVLAVAVIGGFSLWRAVRSKDIWAFLLMAGGLLVPLLLVVIEGKATYYRSAQFVPVVCGYGALLVVYGIRQLTEAVKGMQIVMRCAKGVVILLLSCILWNQCADMNKWFYVDYQKYESAKELTGQIAYVLESRFDTSKPVVFTGTYEIPRGIIQDAYVPIGSEEFYKMKRLTDMVDEHLLEKFYRTYGVWVAQTPALSVIDWARYAFDNDAELVRFFSMHGHELVPLLDESLYPEAEAYSLELPHFPEEGSVVDVGEYIIVHL